ncbi:MAG: hypothetical protein JW837_04935 [Sedimentisphaerales bacterium]|nr:hypothetical protein [Sedimentisphaerales bacterium]
MFKNLFVHTLSAVVVLGAMSFVWGAESVEHYRAVSSVEFKGQELFNNRADQRFDVERVIQSDGKQNYTVTFPEIGESYTFTLDKPTMTITNSSQELQFQQQVGNLCALTLKGGVKNNIGKTWKQSFDLSPLGRSLPEGLSFTLTSEPFESATIGNVVAVRALSAPFDTTILDEAGENVVPIKCRMNAVYVFDDQIDTLHMCSSVFTLERKEELLKKSILCHQTAIYRTDAEGEPVDIGLEPKSKQGKKFSEFIKKIGLREKMLKIKDEQMTLMPKWARTDGVRISNAANICAAFACEGGINPVAPLCLSANRMVVLQSWGTVGQTGVVSVGTTLASSLGTAKLATAPFLGVGAGWAGAIAGGIGGGVAAGSGGGGGSHATPTQ